MLEFEISIPLWVFEQNQMAAAANVSRLQEEVAIENFEFLSD